MFPRTEKLVGEPAIHRNTKHESKMNRRQGEEENNLHDALKQRMPPNALFVGLNVLHTRDCCSVAGKEVG